jgi:ribosomal protein S27AE
LIKIMEDETCENCGGVISIFEQAFVYKDRIVCGKCDKELRALLEVRSETEPVTPADLPPKERAESQKPEELPEFPEFPELQGSPIRISQALDVPKPQAPKPQAPKPIPHKRRRLRIGPALLWPSLVGWSVLWLFLIFYIPAYYQSELKGDSFAVEFLIVSFLVFWFVGALVLYIVPIFTQKDDKLKPN